MKTKTTEEISKRFIQAMNEIINSEKQHGGQITSVKAFARSIGQLPQNFSKFKTHKQHVTLPIIAEACKLYKINPTFLILGEGELFLSNDLTALIDKHEKRIKRLEKMLK